jgi:glycosyltransferase involved in cell wall biosynthesis
VSEAVTFGIVIPTYNSEHNIQRLIRSIQSQTFSSYSIVVVDQDSDDGTAKIARSSGCTVIDVPRPQLFIPWITAPFPSQSRNIGADSVDGKILLHLDSDMELGSTKFLERLETLIDAKHQAAVVREADVATGFWPKCKALERSCYYGTEMEAARAVTRDLFRRVGGYDRAVSSGEDYFVTRLYQRETKIIRDDSLLLLHHTGRYSLMSLLKKKYLYGRTARIYLQRADAVGGRSGFAIVRSSLGAYIKNWRLMLEHPILYICIYPLRLMEFTAMQLGMWFASKVPAQSL